MYIVCICGWAKNVNEVYTKALVLKILKKKSHIILFNLSYLDD